MKQLQATEKITQKMTREGAVEENKVKTGFLFFTYKCLVTEIVVVMRVVLDYIKKYSIV